MKRDLLKVCLEENTPLWDQCLDTPFLQGIAQGTLRRRIVSKGIL